MKHTPQRKRGMSEGASAALKYGVVSFHRLANFTGWWVRRLCAQSCLTLCDPMNCSPPGSSVHEISQARILEWVTISSSRGSSWPRDWTQVSWQADSLLLAPGGRTSHLLRKGWRFPRTGPPPTLGSLKVSLGSVMAPVGGSLSLLMCYSENILKLKVQWNSTCLPSWTHLAPISLCWVLGLRHSFQRSDLPSSLLFQNLREAQGEDGSGQISGDHGG